MKTCISVFTDFKAAILKCGLQSSSGIIGEPVKNANSQAQPQINQLLLKLRGLGLAIHVLTSSPGDPDACESLSTALW